MVYYVIDYKWTGTSFRLVSRAIKTIDPNATIIPITQNHPLYGQQIEEIEQHIGWIIPTDKIKKGRIRGKHKILRTQYLSFKKLLQDYIDKRKAAAK